jgi:hypothetical protein
MLRSPASRSLVLLSCLASSSAFTPLYSTPTQCSPFSVTWGGSNVTTGPPFVLLILPFDASPAVLKLPDSSYDATTKTGNYKLDELPLKTGTQFVLSMDDGYGELLSRPPDTFQTAHSIILASFMPTGRATGGVSLIQTVGSSSDTSCLPATASPTSSFFTLDPAVPSQCSSQTVSWNSTRYQVPPNIRGFIPGGQAFGLDRPASNSTTQQGWDVNIREGTQMVILVQPVASNQNTSESIDARTSPLITVTGKSNQGDSCLGTTSPSSTTMLVSTASVSTLSETNTSSGNVK